MIAAIAVFALVFAAGATFLSDSSDVDGATSYIHGDTNVVKVRGMLTYQIEYFESEAFDTLDISYTAVLKDSSGSAQTNAVSPPSGTLTNGVELSLNIIAPSTAGKYTLQVTFIVKKDGGDQTSTVRTQTIRVVEPIVLNAVLMNNSNVDFTDFAVYFKVDGVLIEDSKTLVSVAAGKTNSVQFEWTVESLSNGKHKFQVVAGDENIGNSKTSFMGGEGTFYVGHSDYGLLNVLLAILLIVLILVVIYVYRKPVKNYGKPKSRR
ncbi:MAG: hypothetical protein FWC29_03720 [Methanomassiliicoccaceae archaeon]|nr:hypothetical protein [Methanomassiliicoccaceae archaeon]